MKKISFLLISSMMFLACSSGGDGDSDPAPANNVAPTSPSLKTPTNNLICINNTVSFNWNASTDADGDTINYQLDIATDTNFTQNLVSNTTTGLTKDVTLEKGKYYYWRVKAIDNKNNESVFSPVYKFYTEMVASLNHVPFLPVLTSPLLNASVSTSSVSLSWTASDSDGDGLNYDVYLGTVNPPTQKVASDITTASFTTSALIPGTKYYWNVVAKDGKGGNTIGQVWYFTKQ
jgi:hypothetical protein